MGRESTNIGLSLLLGNFDTLDKDLVQSLSGIGKRFEVDYSQPVQNHEIDPFSERKTKQDIEQDYKTLFLGGLIEKISKRTFPKVQNGDLQDHDGDEQLFFESNVQIRKSNRWDTKRNDSFIKSQPKKQVQYDLDIPDDRSLVSNLDLLNWEEQIIWDDRKDSITQSNTNETIPSKSHESFEDSDCSNNWGFIESVSGCEETLQTAPEETQLFRKESCVIEESSPPSNSVLDLVPGELKKPKRKYRKRKKISYELVKFDAFRVSPKKAIEKQEKLEDKLQFLNDELMSCDWVDDIYWDECEMNPLIEEKLILDLNDKSMIFDIDQTRNNSDIDFDSIEQLIRSSNVEDKYKNETIPKRFLAKHSKPAMELDSKYYKLFPNKKELKNEQRNYFKKNESFELGYSNPKKKIRSIEKRSDLSACDNRTILMEFVERNPALVNKFGMGTMIVNYCNKPKSSSSVPKFKDGFVSMVETEDEIPLITNLVGGDRVVTTQNNMYSAQLYEQKVNNCDFLLCSRKTSNGNTSYYIREIPSEYLVGHIQPHIEVYPPRTRPLDSYINNALSYHISKKFQEKIKSKRKPKISVSDIIKTFHDNIPRQTIRDKLKELATFVRKDDVWIANMKTLPNEEEISRFVTPEMVCVNEAMLSGDFKLNSQNMDDRSDMVAYELSYAKLEDRYRQLIKSMERVKNNLPWSQTNNFQLCFKSSKENVKLELLEIVQQNVKNIEFFVQEISRRISNETEEILPSMTDSQVRIILLESNNFNEEALNKMSRSERKLNARKFTRQTLQTFNQRSGDVKDEELGKKEAKTRARISVFKEALQEVYLRESIKLENGLNYYETPDMILDALLLKKTGHSTSYFVSDDTSSVHSSKTDSNSLTEDFTPSNDNITKKRGRKKLPSLKPESYYIRKTTFNNTNSPKVEYIHNPTRVSYFQQVQKSKRRSKHFIGGEESEILTVGPRERSRLQALSKEFKKKFNSSKEEATEKLFRKSEKTNTSIKNASSSSSLSTPKRKSISANDAVNDNNNSTQDNKQQARKKTKIN